MTCDDPAAGDDPVVLRLGGHEYGARARLVMAIINRTPDSFYDNGRTWAQDAAFERVEQAVSEGADIVDIGGVKAGEGPAVDAQQEMRRVVDFVARVRDAHPDIIISVDTWRAEVGRAVCAAGADLINDAWGGFDPDLVEVAAEFGVGYVCTHTGRATPRTRPHRIEYDDVVAACLSDTADLADRAVAAGVARDRVLIDPAHDFGKNTLHSLEVTRRLDELVATGWPVLVSLSHKDFIGESLDLPVGERLPGTLAATAVSAWHGAMVHRVHDVRATRQVLDLVAAIRGDRPPARAVRGLA